MPETKLEELLRGSLEETLIRVIQDYAKDYIDTDTSIGFDLHKGAEDLAEVIANDLIPIAVMHVGEYAKDWLLNISPDA